MKPKMVSHGVKLLRVSDSVYINVNDITKMEVCEPMRGDIHVYVRDTDATGGNVYTVNIQKHYKSWVLLHRMLYSDPAVITYDHF